MPDDPRTVFAAENAKLAEAVIGLLASEGIPAEAFSPPPQSETEPITGLTDMVTAGAIEVRVTNEAQAEKAKEILGSAVAGAMVREIREKRANRTGTTTAVCEDCGKSSEWPASAMGTTDTCPHCGGYMDIPDPDDDWSGVDFGADEGENEGEGEAK